MRAKTVGFAIADSDRSRLEILVEHYGQGNRSEFLRVAMKRLEHEMLAERLVALQSSVRAELGGKVYSEQEAAELVRKSAKGAN
jgi:Arc/MetJ-type ribon-helix-helix transcriptional regulator